MSFLRFSLILMMFLISASRFFVAVTFAEVSEAAAASALTGAEEAVFSAYQAVLEEQSSVDVSGLLVRLNEAGGFLAEARMAYRSGDFDKAARLANLSKDIGVEVQNEAFGLKETAWTESVRRMWPTMLGSILGMVLIVLGSIWVWVVFKRRYYARLLRMKPEVASDES